MFRQLFSLTKNIPRSSLKNSSQVSHYHQIRSSCSRQNINNILRVTTTAAGLTCLVWNSSENSQCEPHFSHGFSENIPDHPQTIAIPSNTPTTITQLVTKAVQWIIDFFKLLSRIGSMTIFFTPAIVTSPLLLLNSKSIEAKWWEFIRYGIFCSGPCLTKLSQWIATRPDIFSQKFCKELELLQTKTHQHRWEETVKMLDQIYGPNWNKYLIIDHDSVAGSGLMAQVYHGYLHSNNPNQHDVEIALKILHPGVQDAIKEDLILLDFLVHAMESSVDWMTYFYYLIASPFTSNKEYNSSSIFDTTISLSDALDEFKTLMSSQINFRQEAEAMLRFKHNFSTKKWQHRVKFAEPIDLLFYLQTGKYYPDLRGHHPSSSTSSFPVSPSAAHLDLDFPLQDNRDADGGGILIQTFEHGIPMATYLTESKLKKESNYTHTNTIQTNKQANHRNMPTINGLPSLLTSHKSTIFSEKQGLSSSSSGDHEKHLIHEKHTNRDKEIAALGLDLLLKMLFEDNFIHGDLHPGNLLLSYDTTASTDIFSLSHQPVQLTVLDTGICTELNAEDRKNFILLLKYVIEGDGLNVAKLMMNKSRVRNPNQVILDPKGFEKSMEQLISNTFHNGGLKLSNNGVTKLLNEVLLLCYHHRVRLESGFSSIMLSIGIVEGLGIQLHPEIDVITRAAPFIIKSAARDFGLL